MMSTTPFPKAMCTMFPMIIILALQTVITTATMDGSAVVSTLRQIEINARLIRDEVESAYSSRCDLDTLNQCEGQNWNACSSTFASPYCVNPSDHGYSSNCSCGLLWDKTITGVSIPSTFEGGGRDDNYDTTTICYSRLAEKTMVKSFEELGSYWAEYDVQPGAIYFGDTSGIFRMTPAQQHEECGGYDPRRRPWYKAASSPPKDVVLVIDTSQSMNGRPLLMAQAAAFTILDSLTSSDRVAAVTVSMEAKVLLDDAALVEATDENKKRLTEAIVALETSGIFNWYDAFNSTFDILANSINSSEATIPCSSAVILLTDGSFDDQGQTDASEVISLMNEKQEELAATSNMKNYFFLYSIGDDANTTLTKSIACGTGGLWRHIGDDETQDLLASLSSYYKLFATGLGDGDYTDFVAWVEPYQYEIESGMGSTVSVPVFDRSVTPYQFLGVVGIDIYLDAIQQVFGDNTTSWFQEWMASSSIEACPANDLTECQLDALRFLGGGVDATCGACNNNTDAGSEEGCPSNVTLPTNLWQNSNNVGKSYTERGCCESNMAVPSETCPVYSTESNGVYEDGWNLLVVVVLAIVSFASAIPL